MYEKYVGSIKKCRKNIKKCVENLKKNMLKKFPLQKFRRFPLIGSQTCKKFRALSNMDSKTKFFFCYFNMKKEYEVKFFVRKLYIRPQLFAIQDFHLTILENEWTFHQRQSVDLQYEL